MDKEKEKELERNAGIRKREQELKQKRKQRIHKVLALLGVFLLLGAGAYVSSIAYTDLLANEAKTAIAMDSMYLEPSTEEDTASAYIQQAREALEQQEALTEETEESDAVTRQADAETETLDSEEVSSEEMTSEEEEVDQEEKTAEESQQPVETEEQYVCISNINVNMRSKPSGTASVVGKVPPKAVVTVLDQSTPGWCHIRYNGLDGYVVDTVLKKQT